MSATAAAVRKEEGHPSPPSDAVLWTHGSVKEPDNPGQPHPLSPATHGSALALQEPLILSVHRNTRNQLTYGTRACSTHNPAGKMPETVG